MPPTLNEYRLACGDLLRPGTFPDLIIADATDDSRRVVPGGLFVAVRGAAQDGNVWVPQALTAGAAAIVSHLPPPDDCQAIWLQLAPGGSEVDRAAVARIAACRYGNPAEQLQIIGITGTNGKTTTACLIQHILCAAGIPAGRIGTIGADWPGGSRDISHTTPPPFELQLILRQMADAGVAAVVMEASSHALDQCRLGDIQCQAAVFTHLTQDHLDYHKTLNACFAAKSRLFTHHLRPDGTAVINGGCPWGRQLASTVPGAQAWGRGMGADWRLIGEPTCAADGTCFRLATKDGEIDIRSPLVGAFNVDNMIAAIAATAALGVPPTVAAQALANFAGVPGRMQRLPIPNRQIYVDYAHTDDALDNVLRTLRPLCRGRLIVVFGCGGDRDPLKRPKMAAAVARHADRIILTSDNPRTEDPERILDQAAAGIPAGVTYTRLTDRHAAISEAVHMAAPDDIVLIAGKGHEDYQEIGKIRYPFADAEVAVSAAAALC